MSKFRDETDFPPGMTFRELIDKTEGTDNSNWTLHDFSDSAYPPSCYGCYKEICDQGYSDEEFYLNLHKSCAEVPSKIKHPLHTLHHLTLIIGVSNPQNINICNGCRDGCSVDEAAFYCKLCQFYLDFKCALLMDDYFSIHDRQTYEEREKKADIKHFSHAHNLKLCNIKNPGRSITCCCCRRKISGLNYCCFDCGFYIHESCKDQMHEEVSHPFHPQHSLRVYPMGRDELQTCRACRRSDIQDVRLSCDDCDFDLHYSCVAEPFPRGIKLEYHKHSLFYFGRESKAYNFTCGICRAKHKGKGSIFRCVECTFSRKGNFHLECIDSLLPVVKHQSHGCDLTLLDSVEGYGSPEYGCDICEKGGNSQHHVYSCQECNFIAHIECVITEEEALQEIDSDQEENAVEKFQGLVPFGLDAEVDHVQAKMEELAVKLEAIPGKRASNLRSILLRYKDKITRV